MSDPYKSRTILHSLKVGLAPLEGARHLLVNRDNVTSFFKDHMKNGMSQSKSHVVFIADFFGNGKTVFGHYLMAEATRNNFLVAKIALNRGVNFNKLEAIYNNTIEVLTDDPNDFYPSFDKLLRGWVENNTKTTILSTIDQLSDICEGFADGLRSFYESTVQQDVLGQFRALQHLKGAYGVSVARKKAEKIHGKISKTNALNYFMALDSWAKTIGYSGLVFVFDEVESILNLINKRLRNQAYKNICAICDAVEGQQFSNSLFTFLLTPDLRDNPEKGISSYRPLENYIAQRFTRYQHISTLVFNDLTEEDLVQLAQELTSFHQSAYNWDPSFKITDSFVVDFVQYFNNPILTPYTSIRRFVRQFIDILDVSSQNSDFYPQLYLSELKNKSNNINYG